MRRIAIYLTSMEVGGAQRIALNLCSGLVKKGYSVDLVLVEAKGALLNELPDAVSVVNLDASRVANSLIPLRRYLRRTQPEVLYAMMTEINVIASLAHQLSRTSTRLVISEHNTPTASTETVKDRFVFKLAGITYPLSDHIVTVSRGVCQDLLEIVDLPEESVSIIYNPIDVTSIRESAREPLEHHWFRDESVDVVMSAGRHAPQKGFDTLIKAFARLDNPTARLVLLGEGGETEALRALAMELDIVDRVDFSGFVDNPFKYMANADVFVLSSWYEGFGNVLVEAMATGCPVVATDCPSGPSEILDNGTYGPLVPVREPDAMSDAIADVLNDPMETETLCQRADDFSIDTITERYETVFFDVPSTKSR